MKKIKKLIKKLNNRGSGIVMVVIALGFIGIIVGALLMLAGYTYRQKLHDLNARDNYYYVEQAMNEIYAGVGSKTVEDMQKAYVYTVENMVEFDTVSGSYKTIPDDKANAKFKEQFMKNLENNTFFNPTNISASLSTYITNSSVELDSTKLYVDMSDRDEKGALKSLVIKNVTLTRTQEYKRSNANGFFKQSITTDIVIAEPDFVVRFNSAVQDSTNIFGYSTVADMGIEINQPSSSPLVISGNIYAGADYYNKGYNESTYKDGAKDENKTLVETINEEEFEYTHGSVTSKRYSENALNDRYYNEYSSLNQPEVAGQRDTFNGVNQHSMYSGLYINGSKVSILADYVIVPGTIAVMNQANLSLYGKSGKTASETEVWADNIVLGGYSRKNITKNAKKEDVITYEGSTALFRANLYVKDDTELNATGSNFQLKGSYYGYGDSTAKDERVFVPSVDEKNFMVETSSGKKENRGHYNSSAIIVNGEKSLLDLEETSVLFLAGRSYIELSKEIHETEEAVASENNKVKSTVTRQTYTFLPETNNIYTPNPNDTTYLRDYKTGESISVKSNQQAYIPVMFTGVPEPIRAVNGNVMYYEAKLHTGLKGSDLFEKYFPSALFGKIDKEVYIPCIMQEVSGKKYYYYDFERAYNMFQNKPAYATFYADNKSAQYYAANFIKDYVAELKNTKSTISKYLVDITKYEDFDAGQIILPTMNDAADVTAASVYSSGAITSKTNTSFDMITANGTDAINALLSKQNEAVYYGAASGTTSDGHNTATSILGLSDDLETEYNYVKWNLGHITSANEKAYINDVVTKLGQDKICPINKYINIRDIGNVTGLTVRNLRPALSATETGAEDGILKLASGYSVYINDCSTNGYINVEANTSDGIVKGIVIAKGDVYFDASVKGFEGLIVAGGKVYINNNLTTLTASPEICKAILRECQLSSEDKCKYVLKLFKGYEDAAAETLPVDEDTEAKSIDKIDYTSVVSFSNFMKNVE